jgi:PAS domain S-box-containing protein
MTLFMDKDTFHQKNVSFSQEPQTPFGDGELDYRPLFEQAGDAFFLVSLNFEILSLNVQARRLLGYEDGAEITNENLNLEDPDLRRLILGARTNTFEHLLFRKDGSSFQVELNSTLIVDKHGSPLMIKLVARDIAGYKQYERMLKRNARAQSVISEVTASLFRSANIEGKLPEVLESLGYAMGVFSCVIFELKNSSLRIKHRWVDSAVPEFEAEKVIKPFMDSISKFPNRVFS